MRNTTSKPVDNPEKRKADLMEGFNEAAISANTLSSNIELFDYIFNEYRTNDWGLEKLNGYLALIIDHAERVKKDCDALFKLYSAAHPHHPSVVAMEYANKHKTVVRVFLSDNTILLRDSNIIRAIGLHLHDKVVHIGVSLRPVIEERTRDTVPFPDCIPDYFREL